MILADGGCNTVFARLTTWFAQFEQFEHFAQFEQFERPHATTNVNITSYNAVVKCTSENTDLFHLD